MNKEVTITNEMIASKCGWTPFHNFKVKGFPVGTIVNGNLVMLKRKNLIRAKRRTFRVLIFYFLINLLLFHLK